MKLLSIIVHTTASIVIVAGNCAAQTRSPTVAIEQPARLPSPAEGLQQAVLSGTVRPTLFSSPQPLLHDSQDESPLTLETLEKLALANSPVVEKAAAEVRALRGKWIQAGLYPNPVLGYAGDEMGDAGTAGKQGGFVQQEIVTAGKLGARREVAAREIEQSEQRLAAQNLRVLTDVRAAYFDVLLAQERIKVTRHIAGLSESASETVARLLEARQATRVDLLQAQVETETSSVQSLRAQNEIVGAQRRLAAVIGLPYRTTITVAGELGAPPAVSDWDTVCRDLLQYSPERAAALIAVQRARSNLKQACAESRPNIDLSTTVQKDNVNGSTLTSVQVGLAIPIFNRNQGAIQQAEAEITVADRDAARVELDLQQRLAVVYQRLVDAQLQASRYKDVILPKSEESLQLVTKGYEVGEISYLSLLTAQRTYFQTSLQYLDAMREAWAADVQIKGFLLSGSLTQAP